MLSGDRVITPLLVFDYTLKNASLLLSLIFCTLIAFVMPSTPITDSTPQHDHDDDSCNAPTIDQNTPSPDSTTEPPIEDPLPLDHVWNYYHCMAIGGKWDPQKIDTFSTIKGFWALFTHLSSITSLPLHSKFLMFKYGIDPAWEHPANAKGGRLNIDIPLTLAPELLDDCWVMTLLSMIGGHFEHIESINGAIVSMRHSSVRITLWVNDAQDVVARQGIVNTWRRALKTTAEITFQPFPS